MGYYNDPQKNIHSIYMKEKMINSYAFNSILPMQAFVAPAGFNPDAQEVNIVKAYSAYSDTNKVYIFSVGATATTVLPVQSAGGSYAYSENAGPYTSTLNGTITWAVGSTKRHVIMIHPSKTSQIIIPMGAVWAYFGGDYESFETINNNKTLKYIHLNKSILKSIVGYAFYGAGLVGELTIPNSVNYVGQSSFQGCMGMTGSLSFPNSVTGISNSAFQGCYGFTGTLTLPNTITSIGSGAFQYCTGFTGPLSIPSSIKRLEDAVFRNCSGLTGTLNIPNSVTYIGESAFYYCTGFTGILSIPNSVTSIGNSAFITTQFTGVLSIPNSITSLATEIFENCKINALILPSSVVSIGDICFYKCYNLSRIDSYRGTPATLGGYAFEGVNKSTCTVHVPIGSLTAYRANMDWNVFTNIIEDL